MAPHLITRDSIVRDLKRRKKKCMSYMKNLPKYSTQLLQNLVEDKDSSIILGLSANYFPVDNLKSALQNREYANSENINMSMTTTLAKVDDHLEFSLNSISENIRILGGGQKLIITNLSLSYNQDNQKRYTSITVDNDIIILDTGSIWLWPNQQDMLICLLDKEWQHVNMEQTLSELNSLYGEHLTNNVISRIDIKNSIIPFPKEWKPSMKIGSYSYGRSFPLLAAIKNSPYVNKVAIVTNDIIEAYHWTRYCEIMKMSYEVVRYSLTSKINEDIEVLIFSSITDYIAFDDRNCMQSIKRCIIDLYCIDFNHYHTIGKCLKDDQFEIIYNINDDALFDAATQFPTVPMDNSINTIINESLIMSPTNVHMPPIKINHITLIIRKKQLCSILLLDDLAEIIAPSEKENALRIQLELPNDLRLCQGVDRYLEEVKDLEAGYDYEVYWNKSDKINNKECSICKSEFKDQIRIIYECCCSTCCLNCYNSNVNIRGSEATAKCFMCRTKNLDLFNTIHDYSYLKTMKFILSKVSRILILGHFHSKHDKHLIEKYTKNWFLQNWYADDIQHDDIHFFDIMESENMNVNQLSFLRKPKPIIMLLDTNKPIQPKVYHFEYLTEVFFLLGVPLEIKQKYMTALANSSYQKLDVYHLEESLPP